MFGPGPLGLSMPLSLPGGLRGLGALVLAALLPLGAGDACGSLDYRLKLRFRDTPKPIEVRFTLTPTAPLVTRNRVQKPRLGGWRLEGVQREGAEVPMSMILARTERMLYFAGPMEGMEPTGVFVRFGSRSCRVWQVKTAPSSGTYAYLVEVAPNLLALSYLSASPGEGDLAAIEVQLDRFQLDPRAVPAEEGQLLLRTLQGTPGAASHGARGADIEQVTER